MKIAVQEVEAMARLVEALSDRAVALPADDTSSYLRREAIMKTAQIAILILAIALVLHILIPSLSWADDGAALRGAGCLSHCVPSGPGGSR